MAKSDLKLTGDASQLERELKKVQKELAKMKQGIKATGVEAKKVSGIHKQSFGDTSLTSLMAYAGGFVSISRGIGMATQELQKWRQEKIKAAGGMRSAEMARAQIAELTGGDVKETRRIIRAGELITLGGGAADLTGGLQTAYGLKSAGLLKHARLVTGLYPTITDTVGMIKSAKGVMAAAPDQAGSMPDVLSRGLIVNKYASSMTSEIMKGSAKAMVQALQAGWSVAGTFAATTIGAEVTTEARVGGTLTEAFARSMAKDPRMAGFNLPQQIKKIQALGLKPYQLAQYMPDSEARKAYGIYAANLPQIEGMIAEQRQAVKSDLLGSMIRARQSQPTIVAARMARTAEAGLENVMEPYAIDNLVADSILNRMKARLFRQGGTPFSVWDDMAPLHIERFFRGDVTTIKMRGTDEQYESWLRMKAAHAEGLALDEPIMGDSSQREVLDELRKITENTANLRGSSQRGAPNEDYPGGP